MSGPDERRVHARLASSCRILWSVAGRDDLQIDRFRDVSASGALVATESLARVGEEIRFDLLDEAGEKFATGLARVAWVNPAKGMGIAFLALGVDATVAASLAAPVRTMPPGRIKGPPALPGVVGGPPPMPVMDGAAEAVDDDDLAPQIEPLAVRRTGVIIGIDLGTTNTCASYVVDGRPQIIPGRTGTNTIPSMITFDPDGSFHVGQRAADRQILQPLRTVYGSKRLLGRTFHAELAAELQSHFAYPLGEAEDQRFGARIDGTVISMDAIAARILEEVRSTAELHLGVPVEAAVITVPAYFTDVQREAVRRAAREAKLVVHRIVNEPTAAAVAYGHKLGQESARVAVWDFGGGTFDFSVVDVSDGRVEVVTTGGDNFVGGADFDDLIASYLLAEFEAVERIDVEPDPQQIARLREAAELAKRALSVETEYLVELVELTRDPKRTLRVELTRAKFEELTRALVTRTIDIAREVMTAGLIVPMEIDDVLLVGGSTRIPAVQRAVAELFGRRPSKRINPDEAVALGAALLADEIGAPDAPTLLDILPMSVGRGVAGLEFVPIVARNSRLPTHREITVEANVLGVATVPIFQGESPDVRRNEYLFSAVVADACLQEEGAVTLRLSFDEHCVMAIEACDARTGRALPTRLDRTRPLAELLEELGQYVGPANGNAWQLPASRLGVVLGKQFELFDRESE
ncbi:MAG: hypothetical protein JWM74_1763 [Myxococcaceae bacterium]|nr:hypothetical protein [Myxococcaceae bacterium]